MECSILLVGNTVKWQGGDIYWGTTRLSFTRLTEQLSIYVVDEAFCTRYVQPSFLNVPEIRAKDLMNMFSFRAMLYCLTCQKQLCYIF